MIVDRRERQSEREERGREGGRYGGVLALPRLGEVVHAVDTSRLPTDSGRMKIGRGERVRVRLVRPLGTVEHLYLMDFVLLVKPFFVSARLSFDKLLAW